MFLMGTPMMPCAMPMYFGGCGTYGNVAIRQSIYSNDNGAMVRQFFANDAAPYIQVPIMPFYSGFAFNFPRMFNIGGGSTSVQSKPVQHNNPIPVSAKNNSKTNIIEDEKPTVSSKIEEDSDIDSKTETNETSDIKQNTEVNKSAGNKNTKTSASTKPISKTLGKTFIDIAQKYSKCNEKDGSHHKFCVNTSCKQEDPYDQEWCTDFVTYVVKEAYNKTGKQLPKGFGEHDVERLKNWAIDNGMYIRTSNISKKGSYFSKNIKPGDIFIMNENNTSHTGFVTYVEPNGVIHTIEGNRDDKVSEYKYSPDNPDISGFIRLNS